MTPKRWALVTSIFRAAREKPTGERVAFLDEACGGDESLHRNVERLLAGEAEPSLESPLPDLLETGTLDFGPGETLAQYRVEAKIGEGGMGVVYWGYDARLQRKVALKVLAPERFEDLNRKRRLMHALRPSIPTPPTVPRATSSMSMGSSTRRRSGRCRFLLRNFRPPAKHSQSLSMAALRWYR